MVQMEIKEQHALVTLVDGCRGLTQHFHTMTVGKIALLVTSPFYTITCETVKQ